MSLEQKVNVKESESLLTKSTDVIKKSLTSKILTYSLLGTLTLGGAYALKGCASPYDTTDNTSCSSGSCRGSDGKCYGPCSEGYCTTNPSGKCSSPSAGGVYCCSGGSDGDGKGTQYCATGQCYNPGSGRCCYRDTPYYYNGRHGGSPGCYASCPYVGDCDSQIICY